MSDTLIRKPSRFSNQRNHKSSLDGVEARERRSSSADEPREIGSQKPLQIKGRHDKSYLDLSQMKLASRLSLTSDTDLHSPSAIKYSSSQLFDSSRSLEYGRVLSDFISSETIKTVESDGKPKPRKIPSFLRGSKGKAVFHGYYGIRPVTSAEMLQKKPHHFSEVSFFQTKQDESATSNLPRSIKCKPVLKSEKRKWSSSRRGYYSEVISPYIRPERIIQERQKEEEKILREYMEEFEGEGGEGDAAVHPERSDEAVQLQKGRWKEWPPIYKVLNPEPALAELDLPIAYKEPSLISKGRMPKFAPHLEKVPETEIKDFLHPEEKWVVYETEPNIAFPVQAFMPRCYILHVVEPGTLPRKVFVERRRRQYLSMSVEDLLESHGLTDDDLLPPTTSKAEDQFSLFGTSSFLPLEVFDDDGFDPCSVNDWLALGKIENVQHPIPALAFVPIPANKLANMKIGKASFRYTNKDQRTKMLLNMEEKSNTVDAAVQYLWLDVAVVGYNRETNKWNIVTLDGSQTKLCLPRIYVMFRAEDPQNFALRVLDAVRRRHQTEKLIKFHIYCDSMPLRGLPDMGKETMERIHGSVTRNGAVKGVDEILNVLEADVQFNHKRDLVKMSFINIVKKFPDMFSFVELPESPEEKVPVRGLHWTGMEDYAGVRKNLNWWWLYVLDETYLGMMHVVTACLKVNGLSFFNPSFGKQVTLDEFESIQSGCTNNVIKYLQKEWVEFITTNVRMCLQDVGKGWFNIKEKSWKIYELSKLSRYMELIKFRMQTALKYLVESSTDTLLKIVETPCLACLDVPDENFSWGDDLFQSPFKPSGNPIFAVTLKLSKTDAFYTTSPDAFEDSLIKLYDNCIALSHTIRQVHPNLLVNLRFPDLFLSSIGLSDSSVSGKRERLRNDIKKAVIPLKAYAKEYRKHIPLYSLNVNAFIADFAAGNHSAHEVREEILYNMSEKISLQLSIPSSIVIGPFYVYVEPIKKSLIEKREAITERILSYFAERLRNQVEEINTEFYSVMGRMMDRPTSIEHIFDIKEWLETIPLSIKSQEENIRRIMSDYEVLEQFHYSLENEEFENKYLLLGWPHRIYNQIEVTHEMLIEETEKFYKIQQTDEVTFWERYEGCVAQVQAIMLVSDIGKVHETGVEVRRLWKAMKENQEFGQLLNSRQKLFGVAVTSFELLLRLIKDFTPYKDLWITASDWLKNKEIWLDNPLMNIDGENIDRIHGDMFKTMQKCQRIFAEVPANYQIATDIKNDIDEFRPYIPLIQALRTPGLKDRHWDQIAKAAGGNFKYNPNLTFRDCLNADLLHVSETVVNIAETAKKEHAIEQALDKMEKEWESVDIEFSHYKETGTYIMKLSDEVLQMLDDHIVSTQQLSFSPFKGMFEKRIDEWEEKLKLVSAVLDQWTECQRQWMYLEPIFTSEDISEQLPFESKKYGTMERTWRRVMKSGTEMPRLMLYCPDKRLYEALKECNFLLEQVQKGLSEYLESKRTIFPRLYFLSDDELLEILAQARNPLAVQPHLRKCFENIYKLNFEQDLKITKMFSAEGECVNLVETMYPKGGVESWLLKVEEVMKRTVQLTLEKSLANLTQTDRNKWVLVWPGQIVIAGSQTYWTANVEEGLREKRLDRYFSLMLSQLDGLRNLVKQPLKRVERQILSALIVIEVHARDVTEKIVKENVENVNDFEWISQLRYYWNGEDLKVRAVNAEFQYGYEYLGNSGRLVITPLTDRCYLTLTGALHLKFGGAPAGPAGTGKTETTKDLAKALAIQCVVFNCSDQLDFMAMGKFFKGLASSGAWACFDEFNRIDIEVLSVVAQQVISIQKAQIQRLDRFVFEGSEIALKPSCAVFITMNPGYAGRTELPDNLKALFRPVAMMVPNYTLIAEISLFSFGFSDAKELAGKITTTFKLSSEQLSSQDHYDFGMRAVKTVIAVAGNLKRERPQMDERQIVLRALRDVNVPKFLGDDLKLFNGIVSDLFPRMVEEAIDYGDLEEAIRTATLNMLLEDVNEFVKKVIQLYETTVVRHGLMLVGPTGSGKTKCYEILKDALTSLKGKPSPSGYPFEVVHTYVLNPKSITMGQLYGEFDLLTHEWTDGILPSLVRIGAASDSLDKHWYVFDGPVDAVWIENMNTVLDDNKKLCLTSGEIIKLTECQTMMFEVADLAVASPATVSRCGMVYLEPAVLGLQPFINCWFKRIPKAAASYMTEFKLLFEEYLFPAIELLRTKLKEIVGSIDSAIVFSFLKQMDIRIRPLTNPEGKPLPPKQFMATIPNLLAPWVIYSLIWSVGGTCDNSSRNIFSEWLRAKVNELNHEPKFPAGGLVYDYRLHDGGFSDPVDEGEPIPPSWIHWMADIEEYNITVDMKFSDIEVPTIDNVRNSWHLGLLVNNYNNVLCVGPTGTGKTLTVAAKLSRGLHKKFICDFIGFSARTSANQTQDLIDSKLDKRRRNVYGPPVTKRQIFFIDDLNMPALEVYGAQPPIELLRQWMDFGGWYDRKEIGVFRRIIDTNFVAAMGPPGGGRNPITQRLIRHFHYIAFTELEDDSKMNIFGTIVRSWLNRTESLKNMTVQFVTTTMKVYSTVLTDLLPTPAKTHYTFNLRDLSKVFQGVLMVDPDKITSLTCLLNLWYHENCRIFQDRLVNETDRAWFENLLRRFIHEDFDVDPDLVIDEELILYSDCCSDSKAYERVTDFRKLQRTVEECLEDYNSRSTAPMKLVLFSDALAHTCRISRIIRQPLGNALLLGMGGSGRQSLSRLASHASELYLFQIELSKNYGVSEWRDDIKRIMLRSGIDNRETVFLFSDTQIKVESFLEDLNSVLNSGDVPNIYASEEVDRIYGAMRGPVQEAGLQPTKSNLFATYCKQVRTNLHCILAMSPIGEIFRARLRQFPALVNCCTIDWFFPWPDTALQSVAQRFLEDIPELRAHSSMLNNIVAVCQYMHSSVIDMSKQYLIELNRHNYVTPTLYLELLASYSSLLGKKKMEYMNAIKRLQTGLDKMQTTAEEVKVLEAELHVLKPHLEKAAKEASEMLAKIAADTEIAEETKAKVAKDEAIATKVKEEAQAISDDAQKDLELALPALEAAEKSLQALNKGDIGEVKALKTPPVGVITVIETICIIKGIPPKKVPGPQLGTKVNDYWEPGKKMMADAGQFLSSLLNFDKESITEDIIQKLEKYVSDPNFQPAKIIKVSKACTSLCMWVHAMYKFYFINKIVAPKKAALKEANETLASVQKVLDVTKAKMSETLKGLAKLQASLRETEEKKAVLEANAKLCEGRMDRAFRLINGLADEKERWIETVEKYRFGLLNIVGDILISSGAIAYLTPFTDAFRRRLFQTWAEKVFNLKIPHTPKTNPVNALGDPIVIRQWQIYGLPRDFLSTENGVLVASSKRWPLFIDPQGQANKWVRNMGKEHGMAVAKLSDKDLLRTLEASIRFGKPCLIENVGTELDPALDPVLLRQVFKQAGTFVIKLGDTYVPYNDDFRLYLTTKLPNPHYTPEVSIKVLLVNFTLVPSGLQDQLLALVVMQERPDLEEARSMIVVSSAQMKQELVEIEDRILYKLSSSEGSPVDDVDLIQTLEASKVKSEEIKQKVEAAEITQTDIDNTRALYIPVANRAQILFFCLMDMSSVDPMYQYSMDWFVNIFVNSMANTEKTGEISTRITIVNDYFTFSLYANVCRSLFEKHKLLFAFLLCIRILLDKGTVDPVEYQFLLAGGAARKQYNNPAPSWISERSWIEITSLDNLPNFTELVETFEKSLTGFKRIFDAVEPHRENLPPPWDKKLGSFQKLIIMKCLRPDKVTNAMQDFVALNLGQQFIEPVTTDLAAMYKESSPFCPLIFVLSTGTDPAAELYKFADKMKMTKRFETISLGQGQGPIAEKMMITALDTGSWVYFQEKAQVADIRERIQKFKLEWERHMAKREDERWTTRLTVWYSEEAKRPRKRPELRWKDKLKKLGGKNWTQLAQDTELSSLKRPHHMEVNCHLAPSWMPRLERLIENISAEVHKEFRVWLTSAPSPHFPVSILQNGSKMTVEPPRGIKANMIRAYLNQVTELTDFFHSDAEKVPIFKWLLFSLCLFHGVCLERRKFGPLGFNIPYEFTDGDLRICISQLHMFLLEYKDIPFKVLTYTSGQINYGGRVTDDWDRRCIMNMLSDYYHIKVCNEGYVFDTKGHYHQLPKDARLNDYLSYIRTLPLNDDPSLFGLHPNADISCAQAETFRTLTTLLSLQPRAAGGEASSQEDVTANTARNILEKIPAPINLEMVQKKYPVLYEESLNTVLVQEVIRYNKLLNIIQASLRDLLKALKGLVVMSAKLEEMALSMFNQKVPGMWSSKAYPSLKPLGAWVEDLRERVKFMLNWIEKGIPPAFWISGFYFPQAFLTGTLQNFARKYIISIDSISFTFKVLTEKPTSRPADGCCIYGLFLEGARFDRNSGTLAESKPKELYTDMPYVWLVPKEHYVPPTTGIYECPVYKTLTRAGTLSTTGHSTNYVLAIEVPSAKPQSHWISRGVALFCALDY